MHSLHYSPECNLLFYFIENPKFSDGDSSYYQKCQIFYKHLDKNTFLMIRFPTCLSHLPNASQKCDWELPCSQYSLQAKMFWLCLILFLLFCAVTLCVCALTILFNEVVGEKKEKEITKSVCLCHM